GCGVSPGGLRSDFPTDLFASVRAMWAGSARALAFQQACFPLGGDQAIALHELATTIETAPQPAFAPTPYEIVLEGSSLRVRRMHPERPVTHTGDPLVIIASLINRWYILDLAANQSFCEMMCTLDRPVYVIEWLPPPLAPDDRSLPELCAG